MNKQEYAEYVETVANELNGLTGISSSLCSKCVECADAFGMETGDEFDEAISNGEVFDEGGFSKHPCEVCGSPLGGNRSAIHAVNAEGGIIHYNACDDCMYYVEYGRLDDTTMQEVEG